MDTVIGLQSCELITRTVPEIWLSYRKFKMAIAAMLNFTGRSNAH